MDALHLTHFLALGIWGGLVLAESIMEIGAQLRPADLPHVARTHFWIDMLLEAPAYTTVLVTGIIMLSRMPDASSLYLKAGLGATAIGANMVNTVFVVRRARALARGESLAGPTYVIFGTAFVAIPCATTALVLGLMRM